MSESSIQMENKGEGTSIQYTQEPVFGKLGKIFINSAPDSSGKNAQAFAPVQSGSSSSAMGVSIGGDKSGGGGGGGGGGIPQPQPPSESVPPNYQLVRVDICIDGIIKTYDILCYEVT